MPHDPLLVLARVRRLAHEEALATFARALAAEAAADAIVKQADRSIATELAAASDLDGDDSVVEAFAAWLPGARQRAAHARQACERAQADVSRARAMLSVTKSGTEAVDAVIAERTRLQQAADARAEQHALDDAARRRAGAHDPACMT